MATRKKTRSAAEVSKGETCAVSAAGRKDTLAAALAVLETHRRDTLLDAVATAAHELLRAGDLAVSLPKVIKIIGMATGVDRAHFIRIDPAGGIGRIVDHHLWAAPGIATPPEFETPTAPMAAVGLASWIPKLKRGEAIAGHIREFPAEERPMFELGGIKSTLCVPVFKDTEWVGMIAFDDCRSEREWRPAEIDTIKTLAELVGAAIARTSRLEGLVEADHIIENSATILYRVSPTPPFPLTFVSKNVARYGYDAADLLASPVIWRQRMNRGDKTAVAAGIEAIARGKANMVRTEFRFLRKNGTWGWFEDISHAVLDADGRLTAIEGVLNDISERKESDRRRNDILEAIAASANELLRSSDLEKSLPEVSAWIGRATGVDRAHIVKIDPSSPDGTILHHVMWSAPDAPPAPRLAAVTGKTLTELGFKPFISRLARGDPIAGHTRDFEKPIWDFLSDISTKSILAVPVMAEGRWWGFLGFDDCRDDREWSQTEVDTLKTLGELIGTAVARTAQMKMLTDCARIVENSPTIVYRVSPQPPFPIVYISQNVDRYGYEAADLLASPGRWFHLFEAEYQRAIQADIRALVEEKVHETRRELRLKKPDGSSAWFEGRGYPVRDKNGGLIAIEGVLTEITERKEATQHRDAILEAVAASADELLRSSDLQKSFPKVIEWVGRATGVDRAHIFEVDSTSAGATLLQHYMYNGPGVPISPLLATVKGSAMRDLGLGPWLPRLARGETIVGRVRDFEPSVRNFFDRLGTRSALAVPVCIDGKWWGQLGFNDCRAEREWSPTELGTLKTLADLIGGAVARMQQLQTLADANRIVENSPTILFRLSAQEPYPLAYLSQNVRQFGYEADQLMARPTGWLQLVDREFHRTILAAISDIVTGQSEQVLREFRLNKADGTQAWLEGRAIGVRNETGQLVAIEGIVTDITERKKTTEKIAALARTDLLTGLPNRTAFLDRLQLEFARIQQGGHNFAVLYLDLDHFKDINDTLGHPVGDLLLQQVAERLKTCLRGTDMIARVGGDEFAVLQDEVADDGDVEALAGRVTQTIARPFIISGSRITTSASIGLVPYRANISGADAMMMKADLALYRAKSEGRGQFHFHAAELDEQTRERITISEDLRHAVERQQFELYYQPQIEMESGRIVGLEALIRWNHPTRGFLLPGAFIPIAEASGSIAMIGEWVIDRACRQIREWTDNGLAPPMVAVNLSGVQFKLAPQLDQIVTDRLVHYGVAPAQLELELTETVLMETTRHRAEVFARLRAIGVRIAIDDFGTGYSSLDYLRTFHVSQLKIDRRFIADVTVNADDAAIVRATIGLANELGIEVLAEGVETAAQRDFLVESGCKLAQGYYFARPMPVAAATELLRSSRQVAAV